MGANQSSADTPGGVRVATETKTSYYDLLSIPHDANTDDIKKAYRRKALELHPDRNYGDVERATALFADVQSAYEVLSDPQERAWYDSHEDTILHGGDPAGGEGAAEAYEQNAGLTSADEITRILARFNGGVEFTDAPSGFFGFLRETFERLAAEETRAATQQNLDPIDYPSFGHKADTHEDVVKPFYARWASFASRKTFAWKDKYSTRGVGDRRTRRVIEKENRRFREEGVREFNDAVRALVAFVRKRDPRFRPNTQSEEERQKALRDATRAQAERMRARNREMMDEEVLPEWAKMREPDEVDEETEEESEEEQFECVPCRKLFKSEKQYEAHERSKKHVKTVQALKRKLQKEGVEFDPGREAEDEIGDAGETETAPHQSPVSAESHEEEQTSSTEEDQDEAEVPSTNGTTPPARYQEEDLASHTEHLNLSRNPPPASEADPDVDADPDADSDPDPLVDADAHPQPISKTPSSAADDSKPSTPTSAPSSPSASRSPSPSPRPENPTPQATLGKAALKRAKKAAAQASQQGSGGSDGGAGAGSHACAQCGTQFPSKTRLFQHLRDWGHAAPVAAVGGGGKGKRRK